MHQEYNSWQYLNRRLSEKEILKEGRVYQRYRLFNEIDQLIQAIVENGLYHKPSKTHWKKNLKALEKRAPRAYNWATWWERYLDTYFSFRDASKVVQVYDQKRNEELEYSLDWILQHKVILEVTIIQEQPYEITRYKVGDLKERDRDLTYTVTTIPGSGLGADENRFLQHEDLYQLPDVFKKRIESLLDKQRKGDPTETSQQLQIELLNNIYHLSATFSRKRLKIEHIESFETMW